MIKKIIVVFLLFFLAFSFSSRVWAEDKFSSSFKVDVSVSENGETLVTEKISLQNLTDQDSIDSFTLIIGSTTVSDVSAFDDSGSLSASVEQKENKSIITVKLSKQIFGLGKVQTFTLKFKSKDFASRIGKTWEINLPKMPSSKEITSYDLSLAVPLEFGDPASLVPQPSSQTSSPNQLIFNFNKEKLQTSGISATFGSKQLFDFRLSFSLENNNLLPKLIPIPLPPDTDYQEVFLDKILPQPLNVTIDEDGNYLAWYQLRGRSKEEVNVSGTARLYLKSRNPMAFSLSPKQIKAWTKADRFWETDNPTIKNLLGEIFKNGLPGSAKEKAEKIYHYVTDSLKYNQARLDSPNFERLGAATAVNNPDQAVCREFTDLFIALSRSAGLPARELDGYAFSQNKLLRPLSSSANLFHCWPEYYDEREGWVMVDPTWENTSGGVDYFHKFDLNHLVLAIRGISSTTPTIGSQVQVNVADHDFISSPKPFLEADVPTFAWAGLPIKITGKVSNSGHSLLPQFLLKAEANRLIFLDQDTAKLGPIPPFGHLSYEFNLHSPSVLENYLDLITLNFVQEKITKSILIHPFFFFQSFPYLFLGLLTTFLAVYGVILGLHLFQPPKPKN